MATRRSPLESVVAKTNEEEEEQGGRSLFLRGWLTEAETAEVSFQSLIFKNCIHILLSFSITNHHYCQVLALCEEDDVTLHGLVLAAGLTAVARLNIYF